MPKFYRKELPDTAIVLLGTRVKFDFLKLEDGDPRIPALSEYARKKIGGVVELASEQEYQDHLKKKASRKSLSGMPREEIGEKYFPQSKGEVARYAVKEEPKAQAPAENLTGQAIDFTQFKPATSRGVF